MDNILKHSKSCRLCKSNNIEILFKLAQTPLEDFFIKKNDKKNNLEKFPLDLAICKSCGYVHLPYLVNPKFSYPNYIYESETTVGLSIHYDEYAKSIIDHFEIEKNSFVVDLGSNDGSMLSSFKKNDMRVLGVEPAKEIAQKANDKNLTTINDYFSSQIVNKITKEYGYAQVVTSNYMLANIEDILSFIESVYMLLDSNGIYVIQTGYHPDQFKVNMFDYIYHEHFSYFTLSVLDYLLSLNDMEIIYAEKTSPKGGSIRVVSQKKSSSRPVDKSVLLIKNEEDKANIVSLEYYRKFFQRVENHKMKLIEIIKTFKNENLSIAGFGASHSTTTLIHHFEIGQYIDFLIDDNPKKIGLLSPGYNLEVIAPDLLVEKEIDCILILAWQHSGTILKKHQPLFKKNNIKVIIPLPELSIISSS